MSRQYDIPFERQRWAIGGFSFGGYISLDVWTALSGRFASVSVGERVCRWAVELLAVASAGAGAA